MDEVPAVDPAEEPGPPPGNAGDAATGNPAAEGASTGTRLRAATRAGLVLVVVSVANRFVSLGKEVYVAGVFGVGVQIDAFSLAILVPWLGMALVFNGLRTAFQNRYGTHEKEGPVAAEQFCNQFLTHGLLAGLGLTAVLAAAATSVSFDGMSPALGPVLRELRWPVALLVTPMAVATCGMVVLNVRGVFVASQGTNALPPLAVLAAVATSSAPTASTLMWGMLAGTTLQAVVLLGGLAWSGLRLRPVVSGAAGRGLWLTGASVIAIDVLNLGNSLIDRAMAATLPEGSVSVLHWGALLADFFTSTLVISATTVLVPEIGRQAVASDDGDLQRTSGRLLRYGAVLVLPISASLAVCGGPLLGLFEVGALDASATAAIGACLAAYAFALPGGLVAPLFLHVLLGRGRRGLVVLLVAVLGFVPNVLLNVLLMGPFGTTGLAASTSVASGLVLVGATLAVHGVVGIGEWRRTLAVVGQSVLGAMAGVCAGWALAWQWPVGAGTGADIPGVGAFGRVLVLGAVPVAVFVSTTWFGAAGWEMRQMFRQIRRLIGGDPR